MVSIADAVRRGPEPFALSRRDRRILAFTRRLLRDQPADFVETLRALRAATEELIPAGRVFHLGQSNGSPILGSIVSGVAIVEDRGGVQVVRFKHGDLIKLERLFP